MTKKSGSRGKTDVLDNADVRCMVQSICRLEGVPYTLDGIRTVHRRYKENGYDMWECVKRIVYGRAERPETVCWVKVYRSLYDLTNECKDCSQYNHKTKTCKKT